MYVQPDVRMAALLTAALLKMGTAVTGLVHVHLFTNDFTPTKATLLGGFTELTNVEVPGYATGSINWFAGVPFRQQTGAWQSPSSLAVPAFTATGPPPAPQVVYGYFLTDSTDAILLGSGRFLTPFTFVSTGDGFSLPGDPTLQQTDGTTLTLILPDLEPA